MKSVDLMLCLCLWLFYNTTSDFMSWNNRYYQDSSAIKWQYIWNSQPNAETACVH